MDSIQMIQDRRDEVKSFYLTVDGGNSGYMKGSTNGQLPKYININKYQINCY